MLRALIITAGLAALTTAAAQPAATPKPTTKVVLLGTGNPAADPDRSGPATAIVVNGMPYLVDVGPGVVRRAKAAVIERGVAALEPTNLRVAFVTHLHSDHTVGYPDLIFSPWTLGRRVPIDVYGPTGIAAMTSHLMEAYRVDIETRTNVDGNQHDFPEGHQVNAHEIRAGIVYKDGNVTVTAFATKHAMESYGYRFDTADRSIVISGDTSPTQATIDACHGCDVLIHEVNTLEALLKRDTRFKARYALQGVRSQVSHLDRTTRSVGHEVQTTAAGALSSFNCAAAGSRCRRIHARVGHAPRTHYVCRVGLPWESS